MLMDMWRLVIYRIFTKRAFVIENSSKRLSAFLIPDQVVHSYAIKMGKS